MPPCTHSTPYNLPSSEKRWSSQFKMMMGLLGLKKATTEYFRQETQNSARRLTSHEWTVTSEVSSRLDDVSEATIRMQGATDTHLSQAMFIMREVIEMLNEDKQPIRLPDATVLPVPEGGIPTEDGHPRPYEGGARSAGCTPGDDGREGLGGGYAESGACVRIAEPEAEVARQQPNRERLCSPQPMRT